VSFEEAAGVIRDHAGAPPRIGIVLGSGLGAVAEEVEEAKVVGYDALPGFPRTSVEGHAGRLVLGRIRDVPVAVLQGRAHLYEGTNLERLRTPVRALCAAGAEILVLTNAAGSLRAEVGPGRLMLISDHINLTGVNVLAGPNADELGPRFPSLRDAYDPTLRAEMHAAAEELGLELAEGVFVAVSGPSFETPAEIRAFRTLGADAVGMSTVHETIVARHCGLRVAAVSAISNLAEGMSERAITHEQTLADAARAAAHLAPLIVRFVERCTSPS
jgi:xanthosine phosphorylase